VYQVLYDAESNPGQATGTCVPIRVTSS
jgi:hypothetical protein